jgi:hypothetical protein
MLSRIGPEGMSSDEEDPVTLPAPSPKRKRNPFRVIRDHPWRSPAVTRALRHIDLCDMEMGSMADGRVDRRGNTHNIRDNRLSLPSSRSGSGLAETIPRNLPRDYYDWSRLAAWEVNHLRHTTVEEMLTPGEEDPASLVIPIITW